MVLNVRLLAAVDMWGTRGSRKRRGIIRVEFWVGAIGCILLGGVTLATTNGGWGLVLGAWLVGVGINYIPLVVSAESLSKPGALERELEGADIGKELRRAGTRQLWIAVPLAVAIASVGRRGGS